MKNKPVILGFFAGALYFLWKLIVLTMDKQHEWLVKFPAAPLVGLAGIAVFTSIMLYSDGDQFSDNFKAGARTALVAGITAGLFVFMYYTWFDPEYMPIRIQENLDLAIAAGETPENLKKIEEGLDNFFSAFWFSTFTMSGTAILGMAFSMIISGLKRVFNVL